ncbi:MAG: SDR family NAD(P)-dependent oxidoreductase [Micromonosporaceae bacterium]
MNRPVALITGAGSGIGEAIARQLAPTHDLLLTHLDHDDGLAAVSAETRSRGASVETIIGNLVADETVDRVVEVIRRYGRRLRVLVANAGAYPRVPWNRVTRKQIDDSLALHVVAHLRCAQAASPHMANNGNGRIVMISSILTQVARVDLVHYIAAKGALEAAARALARELGPQGTTVNTIRAGSIEVPAELSVVPDHEAMVARQLARQCIQRRGTPEDVAAAVAYLVSPQGGFITGQTLNVDGGWHLS